VAPAAGLAVSPVGVSRHAGRRGLSMNRFRLSRRSLHRPRATYIQADVPLLLSALPVVTLTCRYHLAGSGSHRPAHCAGGRCKRSQHLPACSPVFDGALDCPRGDSPDLGRRSGMCDLCAVRAHPRPPRKDEFWRFRARCCCLSLAVVCRSRLGHHGCRSAVLVLSAPRLHLCRHRHRDAFFFFVLWRLMAARPLPLCPPEFRSDVVADAIAGRRAPLRAGRSAAPGPATDRLTACAPPARASGGGNVIEMPLLSNACLASFSCRSGWKKIGRRRPVRKVSETVVSPRLATKAIGIRLASDALFSALAMGKQRFSGAVDVVPGADAQGKCRWRQRRVAAEVCVPSGSIGRVGRQHVDPSAVRNWVSNRPISSLVPRSSRPRHIRRCGKAAAPGA